MPYLNPLSSKLFFWNQLSYRFDNLWCRSKWGRFWCCWRCHRSNNKFHFWSRYDNWPWTWWRSSWRIYKSHWRCKLFQGKIQNYKKSEKKNENSNWRIFLDCSPTSPRWNRIWGYQMYCSWQWRQSVWHYFRQLSKSNRPRIPDQWKPSVINFWNGISNIHFQLKHCIGNRLVSFLWYHCLYGGNVPRKYLLEIKYISIKCHFLTRAITQIFTKKGFIC